MMMRLPGSNPRGTMMMLPQLSTSEAADRLWVGYRTPIFASLHSVVASICLAATARGGAQALFILGPASLHALAVYCCVSKQLTPATGRKISAYSSVLSWVLRTGCYLRWHLGSPAEQAVGVAVFRMGSGQISELLNCSTEMMHAVVLLPLPLVAAYLALHLRAIVTALAGSGMTMPLPLVLLWWMAQLLIPSWILSRMHRSLTSDSASALPRQPEQSRRCCCVEEEPVEGCSGGASTSAAEMRLPEGAMDTFISSMTSSEGESPGLDLPGPSGERPSYSSPPPYRRSDAVKSEPNLCSEIFSCEFNVSSPNLSDGHAAGDTAGCLGVSFLPATDADIEGMDRPAAAVHDEGMAVQRVQFVFPIPAPASTSPVPTFPLKLESVAHNKRHDYTSLEWVPTSSTEDLSDLYKHYASGGTSEVRPPGGFSTKVTPAAEQDQKQPRGPVQEDSKQEQVQQQVIKHTHTPSAAKMHEAHKLAPSKDTLQALRNARQLISRCSATLPYKSPLPRRQAIVKLEGNEPEELCQDVMTATNRVLHGQGASGMQVSYACVRKGCTLMLLDLVGSPHGDGKAEMPFTTAQDAAVVQAFLASLLAPGTHVPDGAVAHVKMGNVQMKAQWQEAERSWVLLASSLADMTLHPLQLSLLFVDHPVARLPHKSAESSDNLHRVSLLIGVKAFSECLAFIGSEGHEAAPATDSSSSTKEQVLQCVARGCWGTCLPVSVAAVDWEAEEASDNMGASDRPATVALTLDVDLSETPCGGSAQLELWNGFTLVLSAPLLLLPSFAGEPLASDPVFEELQQLCSQHDWQVPNDEEQPGGVSAILTDIGTLVHTIECISAAKSSDPAATCSKSAEGPGSWGGVVSSTAHRHANDPELLSSMLTLAEELHECVTSLKLSHTTALVASVTESIQLRLVTLQEEQHSSEEACAADASTVSESSCTSAGSSKPGRDAQEHGSLEAPTVSCKPQIVYELLQAPPSPPKELPTFKDAFTATFSGFRPHTHHAEEEQYASWMAEKCDLWISAWNIIFLFWTIACMARSAKEGSQAFWAHLPSHSLHLVPLMVTAAVSARKQHRYHEIVLVGRTAMHTAVCIACAAGLLQWPTIYARAYDILGDIGAELILLTPSRPLRFSCNMVTQGFAWAASVARLWNSGLPRYMCLGRAVVPRLCSLTVGLTLDAARRYSFLHEVRRV